jgi:hypothetical protein
MGANGPEPAVQRLIVYAIFAVPVVLGVYLLSGASLNTGTAHVGYAIVCCILLSITAAIAFLNPTKFDLDVIGWYLFVFGVVVFGTLGVGYFFSRRRTDEHWPWKPPQTGVDD